MFNSVGSSKSLNPFSPFGLLFRSVTSDHGRRIMYISSLYFRIKHVDRLKEDAIAKLNAIMHLAVNDDALRFPSLVSNFMWRKIPIDSILTADNLDDNLSEDQARTLANKVVASTPRYFQYDKQEAMQEDVYNLIMGCTKEPAFA